MIRRQMQQTLLNAARDYPVVTVTGPRQAGKTTLVKACFPSHDYCNLEDPELRRLASEDPKAFFHRHQGPVIIDEMQRVPQLLSWIQVRVDESDDKGAYILTGSHQFRLHEAITQSLAGRTALLRLLPLSISELSQAGIQLQKEDYLLQGCMPRIHKDHIDPTALYRNYFQTYVERDVREIIQLRNLRLFERFMQLLAARVGQTLNLHALAGEVGVSSTTLGEWLSVLEASYVIFTLPPYYRNFGKRLIKSPKLYFVEPGLAAWLLGIETPQQALRDPLHGGLFENLVIMEAVKARLNAGRDPRLYFWRDSAQREIDLLIEHHRKLFPVEIKSAQTWHDEFLKNIRWFCSTIPDADQRGAVVYAGDRAIDSAEYLAVPFANTSSVMP